VVVLLNTVALDGADSEAGETRVVVSFMNFSTLGGLEAEEAAELDSSMERAITTSR
jgi:hypothetical protein